MSANNTDIKVYRVNYELENIGERVAASKKRVTWRFVFSTSTNVHTIILEHSRMTARKRIKLDGVQVARQETFTKGPWAYTCTFSEAPLIEFTIIIQDVRKSGRNLDDMYRLMVNQTSEWQSLPDRQLMLSQTENIAVSGKSQWGSESYARKIKLQQERGMTDAESRLVWQFTFGRNGEIHKLVLEHHRENGEVHVILNQREIGKRAPAVAAEARDESRWEFEHVLEKQEHVLKIVIDHSSSSPQYSLFLNGSNWNDIAETEYELQAGWEPIHSRSSGKVYYRNDATRETQWTKPVVSKGLQSSNDGGTDLAIGDGVAAAPAASDEGSLLDFVGSKEAVGSENATSSTDPFAAMTNAASNTVSKLVPEEASASTPDQNAALVDPFAALNSDNKVVQNKVPAESSVSTPEPNSALLDPFAALNSTVDSRAASKDEAPSVAASDTDPFVALQNAAESTSKPPESNTQMPDPFAVLANNDVSNGTITTADDVNIEANNNALSDNLANLDF